VTRKSADTRSTAKKVNTSRQASAELWKPEPVRPPRIESDLVARPGFERALLALGYGFRRFEYFLSPRGTLREWIRLCLFIGTALLVASFLVVPPLGLLVSELVLVAGSLSAIAQHMTIVLTVALAVGAGVWLARRRNYFPQRQRHYGHHPFDE